MSNFFKSLFSRKVRRITSLKQIKVGLIVTFHYLRCHDEVVVITSLPVTKNGEEHMAPRFSFIYLSGINLKSSASTADHGVVPYPGGVMHEHNTITTQGKFLSKNKLKKLIQSAS